MSTTESIFLCLLFSGILALLAGLLTTRVYWRSDMPPYGRRTRLLDVTLHPEKYATDGPVRVIRVLNFAGIVLLGGAVSTVIYELLRTIRQP